MEYQKIKLPNGELMFPEETIDGTYEKMIARFFEEEEGLLLKEIKLWECNCPEQMFIILEKLLSQDKETVMDFFRELLEALILSSRAYQIKLGEITFSYSPETRYESYILSLINNTNKREVEIYKGHMMTFYDEKKCEQVLWTYEEFFSHINVMELKENPDERFAEYVKSLRDLWKVLLRNRDNTLIKMRVICKAYRIDIE